MKDLQVICERFDAARTAFDGWQMSNINVNLTAQERIDREVRGVEIRAEYLAALDAYNAAIEARRKELNAAA